MSKNVVITGSTQGIGRALAREFARRGHSVVLSGRSQENVDKAVAEVSADTTGKVVGHATDVTDPTGVQGLWDQASADLGSVDLWINNAGVAHTTSDIVDTDVDDIRTMVTTNMLGTIYGSQVAVRGMAAQPGGGQVFNMLGGGSDGKIRPNMGVYSATKRGLDLFTQALVKETKDLAGGKVRVGQIRPGLLITEGWLREAARAPEQVSSQRRILNILLDDVDDVAPYLVERMLTSTKPGDAIAWLTTTRLTKRFMTPGFATKHDVLARHGL
ncbi:SDR family oxidoreductase [Nocardioides sp.]|uniref:SDR family oxidoreductase n=1 Tax=Nocardioides sp. TaxID=35761 RepID=UPI003568611E